MKIRMCGETILPLFFAQHDLFIPVPCLHFLLVHILVCHPYISFHFHFFISNLGKTSHRHIPMLLTSLLEPTVQKGN